MADSSNASADYAPAASASATKPALAERVFLPRLVPTLAAALLIPLFIAAGQWQWNKAVVKSQLQSTLDTLSTAAPVPITPTLLDAAFIQHRKVTVKGFYDPRFQILIDNRLHDGRTGYHVLTPLRIEGGQMHVLVNRGWFPAFAEHHRVPDIETPPGLIEVAGVAAIPSSRFFTLGPTKAPRQTGWETVWPNTDMQRYSTSVDFPIQPFIIQLDAQSGAGGFVREWPRPDSRRQVNLGYAFQWWGFAATTLALWLFFSFRKVD